MTETDANDPARPDADPVKTMMGLAQALTDRAKTDPAVAEALLADPGGLIARLMQAPLPHGAVFGAERNADGEVELSLDMDSSGGGFVVDGIAMAGNEPKAT